MRNLKTSGGLTHGSGMSEEQRNVWTLSMPLCASAHQAIQEMTNTTRKSGEQHTEMGPSRISRDWKDTGLVADFLHERNPFEYGDVFCNIANGVHAHSSVNVDNAAAIGESILEKMVGEKVSDFSFKKKDQAVTMGTKNGVKVDGEIVQFEPHILFQKLAVAAERTDKIDPETIFKHELTTIPKALAETPELLHEAQKSTLADAIWSTVNQNEASIPDDIRYVIDGGALLHRIPWSRGSSYESIIETYSKFVTTNYGKAIVVFDGYEEFTTKDMTHKRRLKGKKGVSISFSLDMSLSVTKEAFLSDPKNKQRFIDFLGTKLTNQGCQVFYDKADADLLIVQKTIESATSMGTVLIGEDTDLLVLLIHHTPSHGKEIFFASDRKKKYKRTSVEHKRGQNKIGHLFMQTHTFFTCIFRMRHNISVVWHRKRVHFEKIQRK